MPVHGFIGLGNMGAPMSANLVKAGFALVVHDAAGTQARAPAGAALGASAADVAAKADTIFLSLPDGKIVLAVLDQLLGSGARRARIVVDLSTVGIEAAREAERRCAAAGLTYIDAPVSGGRAGAVAASLAIMAAGPRDVFDGLHKPFAAMAKNVFYVGAAAGMGQALKLLNNFLSATALAATSEAFAFGLAAGLDLKTMYEVVNVSTGRNTATLEKFPQRIVTEKYDSGFATALMAKDVALYAENVGRAGTRNEIGAVINEAWQGLNASLPGSDHTRMWNYISKK
ncbi:MAG: NAD(P)-dependent oxidoreductase [Alphaproteobacteria bacterium]